jgi:hypothetical protein
MRTLAHNRLYRYETVEFEAPEAMRGMAWKSITLVAIVLVAALAFVWLRSSTERMQRSLAGLRHEHQLRLKELENLRIELETYKSGRYVLSAVNRLGLNLRPPYPGQVRRVAVTAPAESGNARRAVTLLAQN